MVRKLAQVSLAVFLVLAMASMAAAASNVAYTSQKGSLLVFPKVINYDTAETYIFIGNDQTSGVYVKCYWMNSKQQVEDFHFWVTANQPIVFTTTDNIYGPPFDDNMSGALTCWAQNAADTAPVKFNHLYGYAMLTSDSGSNVFYNAHSFMYRGDAAAALALNGELPLDGINNYDACPKYLITTFVPHGGALGSDTAYPDITLWPCKQDLRQDRIPTYTKAKFDVWNWNEVKFTGAYKCFKCWYEGFLNGINRTGWANTFDGPGFGEEKFYVGNLSPGSYDPEVARLRVQGVASNATVCGGQTALASPLLGVMLYGYAEDENPIQPIAGHNMHGAGYDLTGKIYFDKGEVVPDEVIKQ